ncbi:MAG: carbon-nitrogen hydrolase family protein [Anaerolineae bacterium]|nr:carbon-nitrogen hydrolase family protein [Anaerolineae bacterium]
MRPALVVHRILPDREANLRTILAQIARAAEAGAALILLGEAALTGLTNDDCPAHDLPLGEPIPGPATERLVHAAAAHGVWLGLGLLEREDARLYDTALLFTPDGEIGLRYRRMHGMRTGSAWRGARRRASAASPISRTGSWMARRTRPCGCTATRACTARSRNGAREIRRAGSAGA